MSRYKQEEYVQDQWDFDSASKRSILGFTGFLFQAILLILLFVTSWIRTNGDFSRGYRSLLPMITITTLIAGIFWSLWYRESRRLRTCVTKLLNKYGDITHFEIPRVSAFNSRYVPEIALMLVVQAVFFLFFILWLKF